MIVRFLRFLRIHDVLQRVKRVELTELLGLAVIEDEGQAGGRERGCEDHAWGGIKWFKSCSGSLFRRGSCILVPARITPGEDHASR